MKELTNEDDKKAGVRRFVVSDAFNSQSFTVSVEKRKDQALGDEPVKLEVCPGEVSRNGDLADALVDLASVLNKRRGGFSL